MCMLLVLTVENFEKKDKHIVSVVDTITNTNALYNIR